jgi:anti-sigma factor RsiW
VRKELVKRSSPGAAKQGESHPVLIAELKPSGCKAMFAELSNYLDEQLDDSLCEELEKHMEGCEPCKAFLSSLQATIEECRKSPADFPNAKRAAKLRKQIVENYPRIPAVRS